jgi:hypothetical protein
MVGIEYPAGDMQGLAQTVGRSLPRLGQRRSRTRSRWGGGSERGAPFLVRKTNAPLPFGSSCLPNARHRHTRQ